MHKPNKLRIKKGDNRMDDMYKQALNAINSEGNKELKKMVEEMSMIIPSFIEIGKIVEKESINNGFTEQQSFDMAKEYIISSLVPNRGEN